MHTIDQLRARFFAFFQERGHVIIPPASLIPEDSSVLFTTAGMQQFKTYYTGERDPLRDIHATSGRPLGALSAASIQPVVRTSDIDEVGDATHLTFFEMCGNFAFRGAYFKREAITYAWDFLAQVAELPSQKLYVTIFAGDEEVPEDRQSRAFWEQIGISKEHIFAMGRKDNFWGPTGKEGPCGPTTEIHVERREVPCERGKHCVPNCPCGRFLEVWNLVFNEYYANASGKLTPLTSRGVDTGMGLERLALVYYGAEDVFGTPIFSPPVGWIVKHSPEFPERAHEATAGHRIARALAIAEKEGAREAVRSARIVADHIRAAVFLGHIGILPANTDRGYILRRLLRRAALHARALQLPSEWLPRVADYVLTVYDESYPQLLATRDSSIRAFTEELQKFEAGLTRGLREFERIAKERYTQDRPLSGEDLFRLFETYGFPAELSIELARRKGLAVELETFQEARQRHQEKSRTGAEKKFGGHGLVLNTGELRAANEEEFQRVLRQHTATHMLQSALRQVVGNSVEQRGSDITAQRLRFDFSFPRKLTQQEIRAVELLVNEKIKENLPVTRQEMPFQEALASGALAFAKGSYPEIVSVYTIPGFSREVCGGPHVEHTGQIGELHILKEEASAAGVRRIRASVRP